TRRSSDLAPAAHLRRGAGVYLLRFPQGSDRRTDTGRRRCRRQGAGNSQEHRSAHRRRLRHPRCRFSGRGGQGGRCGGGWQRAGASGRAASRRHVQATGSNGRPGRRLDRKSTRLNSSHVKISYAVFCLKKKKKKKQETKKMKRI